MMTMIIKETLRPFGVTRCYHGYPQFVIAVSLALENEDRLEAVVKTIYTEVAKRYNSNSWRNVERNFRTLAKRAWQVNPALMQRMAGYPLSGPPEAAQFIEMVVAHIQRSA